MAPDAPEKQWFTYTELWREFGVKRGWLDEQVRKQKVQVKHFIEFNPETHFLRNQYDFVDRPYVYNGEAFYFWPNISDPWMTELASDAERRLMADGRCDWCRDAPHWATNCPKCGRKIR